ncbi:unnamed protein product, partial [Lampetra fluviatilis]
CCPFPAASALPSLWRENRAALLGFVAEAHRGVRGVVVDATTGVALQETELLLPWGAVRTDGAEFRVYLPVGTHAIGVRAPGYTERVLTVVEVVVVEVEVDVEVVEEVVEVVEVEVDVKVVEVVVEEEEDFAGGTSSEDDDYEEEVEEVELVDRASDPRV